VVLKPRIPAPDWTAGGNPAKAAKGLRFRPTRENKPWFDEDQFEDCLAICNGDYDGRVCPMRQQCLEFSIINNEAWGVWGGMLPHDRKAIRIARRQNPYLEIAWHPPTPVNPDDGSDDLLLLADEEEYDEEELDQVQGAFFGDYDEEDYEDDEW